MDVKITFFNSNNLREVITRRLKFDVIYTFEEFLFYLKNYYVQNEMDVIYVKWKGNNKWLCSEHDWQDLITSYDKLDGMVIKLTVYHGNVHLNVICDVCSNNVIGDRFKCLQCDDFDICQLCFLSNPAFHKEHCLIILRSPLDSSKYIKAIPIGLGHTPDFRVIDINLHDMITQKNLTVVTTSTQTENFEGNTVSNVFNKLDQIELYANSSSSVTESLESSVLKEYLEGLPRDILESLEKLKMMGYTNIGSPLVALLVANNGDIHKVLDELEYSQKH